MKARVLIGGGNAATVRATTKNGTDVKLRVNKHAVMRAKQRIAPLKGRSDRAVTAMLAYRGVEAQAKGTILLKQSSELQESICYEYKGVVYCFNINSELHNSRLRTVWKYEGKGNEKC